MSVLFTPKKLGTVTINNRFVHSATYEGLAQESGETTPALLKRYETIARGETGLVIPGHLYVHPLGRCTTAQAGIHSDLMIPGLSRLADTVHREGNKIFFQLSHAGRQTTREVIGQTPLGPSSVGRDPVYRVKPEAMTETEIGETINAFRQAARRAVEAGADGIQLHAAHGYLINQFLSPYFNRRQDAWGGCDENRFRLLGEIAAGVKEIVPRGFPLLVKLNACDYTPREGITPALAAKYARRLAELGIDGIEVSCGSTLYSPLSTCRGAAPAEELAKGLGPWKRFLLKYLLKKTAARFSFVEGYNLEAARMIKEAAGDVPVIVVGGMRSVAAMSAAIENGCADFIALSRPFINDPFLVKRIKAGETDRVSCSNCNLCLAEIALNRPTRCRRKSMPGA
ncbi:MAG: NADH:flavin oxidoreductase [Peptococcaceae bacterium]|jgi:2,4-dienoyl-CoA reductase-like NADH-dependent reductase (Old Yellow Enzyme family)|nr:NADH:flavin oxidoreductase [Peptococcaceae bacterium]MDH7526430.1 NADH:flavin oxidoreductase [Peptococcaceae bacterium]